MTAALAFTFLLGITPAQSPAPVPLYVCPTTRDGFVEVDQSILDSIADIEREVLKDRGRFKLVRAREQATLVLEIIGRKQGPAAGGVGAAIAGTAVMVPINGHIIDAVLLTGTYRREMTGEDTDGDSWRKAASDLVRDIAVWVDANRSKLPPGE